MTGFSPSPKKFRSTGSFARRLVFAPKGRARGLDWWEGFVAGPEGMMMGWLSALRVGGGRTGCARTPSEDGGASEDGPKDADGVDDVAACGGADHEGDLDGGDENPSAAFGLTGNGEG